MARKGNRPSSYSDYTLDDLKNILNIDNITADLDLLASPIEPSSWLKTTLEYSKLMPLNTEKAKSEWLIAPILTELSVNNPKKFHIFSGNTFDVDKKRALHGRCDFLLAKNLSANISAPIFSIFEAKDDSLDKWYGQCGSEMFAARLFNEQKNEPYFIIYGAITNGRDWQFLRLEDNTLLIDIQMYSIGNLPQLLGTLQKLIDFYDKTK